MRSPVRSARASPSMPATTVGGASVASPSASAATKDAAGSSVRKTASAAVRPERTPGSFTSSSARACRPWSRSASVVRSPEPTSSASASRTTRSSLVSTAVMSIARRPAPRRRGGRRGRPALGSSMGKSIRKWPPRLSLRTRAPSPTRRASRWRERRSRSSPAASRTSPASCQSGAADVRVDAVVSGRRRKRRETSGQPGLVEGRQRGPASEDEALEQRVRRQPVRAVDAGTGALAGCVETGQAGATVEVGDDAAHRVVGGRRDRDRLGRRVVALRQEAVHQGRGSDRGRSDAGRGEPYPARESLGRPRPAGPARP